MAASSNQSQRPIKLLLTQLALKLEHLSKLAHTSTSKKKFQSENFTREPSGYELPREAKVTRESDSHRWVTVFHVPYAAINHASCWLLLVGFRLYKTCNRLYIKKLLLYVTHCLSDSINSSVWLCYKIFIKPNFLPFFSILLVTFVSSTLCRF